MEKQGKKYIIKESELKEIIQEMLLMEVYNPNDYKDSLYLPGTKDRPLPNIGDVAKGAGNLIKGIPGALIPDSWKEKVANGDNEFLKWMLGALSASAPGTAGGDYVPDLSQALHGKAQNADAHEKFNVAAACQWLAAQARGNSGENCARNVRLALNRGGLDVPYAMPHRYAYQYYNMLSKNGWQEIPAQQAGQAGDVVVVESTWSINRVHNYKYGHIAMCIGNGRWASDFLQRTPTGLRHQVPPERVHYFRYKNRV